MQACGLSAIRKIMGCGDSAERHFRCCRIPATTAIPDGRVAGNRQHPPVRNPTNTKRRGFRVAAFASLRMTRKLDPARANVDIAPRSNSPSASILGHLAPCRCRRWSLPADYTRRSSAALEFHSGRTLGSASAESSPSLQDFARTDDPILDRGDVCRWKGWKMGEAAVDKMRMGGDPRSEGPCCG